MIKSVTQANDSLIINLEGTLDLGNQTRFKEELQKLIPPNAKSVILGFQDVSFIDSACLGALISLSKNRRQSGGDISLAALSDEVLSVFQITRLDKIFKIYKTVPQAIGQ